MFSPDVTDQTDETDSRQQGVEFGPLVDDLADEEFPMTEEELLESYGDYELGLEGGDETVREVLAPKGGETYESVAGVERAILNMVGSEAVGREGYSDRGGETDEVNDADESL